jgi:tRNA A-37 threonylcarbamoyl transferase component Bud32/tetratricopeptide (TPR) repeat protein
MKQGERRARAQLAEYAALPADERTRRLAALAVRDPEAYAALSTMLAVDEPADDPDAAHAGVPPHPDPSPPSNDDSRIGTRLGPWRIERRLGAGGTGTVYEAQRDDGHYAQRVALKCLHAELASPAFVRTFVAERNHLARLEHAGIATPIDSGLDGDGIPWFAMRYVDGVVIDRWCDARSLGVRGRVELLMLACDAVAYAHAQGVLHGDLKPSNVLMTPSGQVQLIDFGISTAMRMDAPESQAVGEACSTAADVHALGTLTYRLLCAREPLPANATALAASEPPPIAMDVVAAQGGAIAAAQRAEPDARTLARRLAGDLSAIALKAVAPRPQDRYPSVRAFGDDLRRWLDDRPVEARGQGRGYRARKFLRRHRLASAFAGAIVLAVVVGLGAAAWQYRRAEREMRATASVAQLFSSMLGTATLSGLGNTPFSSRNLLAKTERDLRALPLADQPALFARGLATLARSYAVIGDYRHAESLANEASRTLDGDSDDDAFIAATQLAMLNTQARFAHAEQLAKQQLDALDGERGPSATLSRVAFGMELATAQRGLGKPFAALRTLDAALAQAQALGKGHEEQVAEILIRRGAFLAQLLRPAAARADFERAVALAQPVNAVLADDAREGLVLLATGSGGAPDVAQAERLLAGRRKTLGEQHPKTGRAWILLGYAQFLSGRKTIARSLLLTGQSMIETAYGRDHPEYAFALMRASTVIGAGARDNVAMLRDAVGIYRKTLGPRHDATLGGTGTLAARLADLPASIRKPQDHKEAEALFEDNLRIKREAGLPAPWEKLYLAHSFLTYGEADDMPETATLLRDSAADARRYFEPGDRYVLMARQFQAMLDFRMGRRAEADREFARIVDDYATSDGLVAHLLVHYSLILRALHAFETCRAARADALLAQTVAFDERKFGPDGFTTLSSRTFLDNLRTRGLMADATGSSPVPDSEIAKVNERGAACAPESR